MRGLLTGIVTLLLVSDAGMAQTRAPESETYQSAAIDAAGNLAITRSDGQVVVLRKQGEQTSFSTPLVSPAKTAVAAQAMFSSCCTSYDIPLELVVYGNGRVHRFKGVGLPIFDLGIRGRWDSHCIRPTAGPFRVRGPLRAQGHCVRAADRVSR